MNKKQIEGHVSSLVSVILIALLYSAIQTVSPKYISPSGVVVWRMLMGVVVIWLASIFIKGEQVEKRDLYFLLFAGAFLMYPFQYLFVAGIAKTSAIDASIINTSTPVIIFLILFFLKQEKFTRAKVVGLLCGLGGAMLTILMQPQHSTAGHPGHMSGDLLVFGASAIYAVYLVSIKGVSRRYKPLTIMKWTFLSGSIPTLVFGIGPMAQSNLLHGQASVGIWAICISICVFMTVIPYLLIPVGIKTLSPSIYGTYNYLAPLIAAVTSILLGQDKLMWDQPIALILIILGVILVNKK
ncbi:MAG: DMT family transporter [Paludibacteraceae bacterium]